MEPTLRQRKARQRVEKRFRGASSGQNVSKTKVSRRVIANFRDGPRARTDRAACLRGDSAGGSRGMEDRGGLVDGTLGGPVGRAGRGIERIDGQRLDRESPEFRPRGRLRARRRRRGRLVRARRARARFGSGKLILAQWRHRSGHLGEQIETDGRAIGRVVAPSLRRTGREQADCQERQRRPDKCPRQRSRWNSPYQGIDRSEDDGSENDLRWVNGI